MRVWLLLPACAAALCLAGCAGGDTATTRPAAAADQRVPPGWRHPELERWIRETTAPVALPGLDPKVAKDVPR